MEILISLIKEYMFSFFRNTKLQKEEQAYLAEILQRMKDIPSPIHGEGKFSSKLESVKSLIEFSQNKITSPDLQRRLRNYSEIIKELEPTSSSIYAGTFYKKTEVWLNQIKEMKN